MPWSIERRDKRWCVVKDADGSSAGCHDSRTDAVKQQRALYANEARVAAMYVELDSVPEEMVEVLPVPLAAEEKSSELVKIVVGNEQDRALTASVVHSIDAISERLAATEEMSRAMVAALQTMGQPIINVPTPSVTVEPAQVTVEVPEVTITPPDVNVTVDAPQVSVHPQIVVEQPQTTKTITFERDLSGRVTQAEVVEGSERR